MRFRIKNGFGIKLNSSFGGFISQSRAEILLLAVLPSHSVFLSLVSSVSGAVVGETRRQEAVKLTSYVLIKENSDKYGT